MIKRPWKIAMYPCRLPGAGRKGGAEVYVDCLASALVDRRHHVIVWTYLQPSVAPQYEVRVLRPARVEDHFPRASRRSTTPVGIVESHDES